MFAEAAEGHVHMYSDTHTEREEREKSKSHELTSMYACMDAATGFKFKKNTPRRRLNITTITTIFFFRPADPQGIT